jgi:hypothetical protein
MTTINNSSMSNILGASAAVAPSSASQSYLSVTVSEVSIDGKGNATITWSDALYSGAHTVGRTITIPSQLAVPNTSLILGEIQYKL